MGIMTAYSLEIQNTDAGAPVVDVQYGSLAVISAAEKEAREVLNENTSESFRVQLLSLNFEVNYGLTSVTLLDMSADGSTVADVLKARLGRLRKAEKDAKTSAQLSNGYVATSTDTEDRPQLNPNTGQE
jgi:hypothetical protein